MTAVERHVEDGSDHQHERRDDREWFGTAANQHETLDAGIGS